MAKNDIDRALRDLVRAHDENTPDFTYRVRISVGHLVEAIDALRTYSEQFPEVRDFLKRLPSDAQERLRAVRGALQQAGPGALQRVRHNTFHYPQPNVKYNPTSDEQLASVLAAMGDRPVEVHLDGDTMTVTLTFADDAALNLATGQPGTPDALLLRHFEVARDSALAFVLWEAAVVRRYMTEKGHYFGEPVVVPKPGRARSRLHRIAGLAGRWVRGWRPRQHSGGG